MYLNSRPTRGHTISGQVHSGLPAWEEMPVSGAQTGTAHIQRAPGQIRQVRQTDGIRSSAAAAGGDVTTAYRHDAVTVSNGFPNTSNGEQPDFGWLLIQRGDIDRRWLSYLQISWCRHFSRLNLVNKATWQVESATNGRAGGMRKAPKRGHRAGYTSSSRLCLSCS